jgi:protein-disulfide isomerase
MTRSSTRRVLQSSYFALLAVLALSLLPAEVTAKAAPAAREASTVFVRPHSPIIGPAKAPVTIVEFFDPSCEACLAMYPYVKMIMAEYPNDVRLVLRFLPLHKGSGEAIGIIEAARKQGVFLPVLEAVLEKQPLWHDGDMTSAWAAAKATGLNLDKARALLKSSKLIAGLKQDQADRLELGVRGTPTFFVNGKLLTQLSPRHLYEQVQAEVEASRKKQSE